MNDEKQNFRGVTYYLRDSPKDPAEYNGLYKKIFVDKRLSKILTQNEFEAILLHEEGHRQNERKYDICLIGALLLSVVCYLIFYNFFLTIVILFILAQRCAIYSEYRADEFIKSKSKPEYLESALNKIHKNYKNTLLNKLIHPSVKKRVKRLRGTKPTSSTTLQ